MEYAAESRQQDVAEELLSWFLERGAHDCFAACLYQVCTMHLSIYQRSETKLTNNYNFNFSVMICLDLMLLWNWRGGII